jgi:hypothetical protein
MEFGYVSTKHGKCSLLIIKFLFFNNKIDPIHRYVLSIKVNFYLNIGNQIWPLILEKAIAKAVGGYSQLFSLSIGQIFSILTGSNHFTYSINENISKNKYFLK